LSRLDEIPWRSFSWTTLSWLRLLNIEKKYEEGMVRAKRCGIELDKGIEQEIASQPNAGS
jgi:hypothetical protein